MWQERITFDPKILTGKPIVKGTRLAVDFIIDLLVNGWTNDVILQNYPQLTLQDIAACLEYASTLIKEENVVLI